MTQPRRRAVFLDRDGVLCRAVVHNGKPYPPASLEELDVLPNALEALCRLRTQGFRLYVVTNQPDVVRGTQRRSVVEAIHNVLRGSLPLDDFYVCYHDDADGCNCRKPKPGLLLAAAAEHKLSLPSSYMIGDRWRDIDCGHAAECTTILIDRGYDEPLRKQPHFRVPDLLAATAMISSLEGDLQCL
jgi:D-glycero-D-manno-heptose 1,7-bisphosphate phosphatase